ncbi:prolyl oligopeptidase family serine peptidase [Pareuzebyella sediminis]|uniref:prolyl oligopeptidase family serine peptidase n=1 Tax=Pareuzebyella sediminis TaxID=2607998 RepID=UPI001E2C0AB2|nr:prolyl oligopeptidase family serine peptidase [Pareuzebyella sediminis]
MSLKTKVIKGIAGCMLLGYGPFAFTQSEPMKLWPNGAPGAKSNVEHKESYTYDSLGDIRGISKVSEPTLTPFLVEEGKANGAAVVICPGGGYSHLAIKKEGYKVAKWLNSLGISAFVLKYRLPSDIIMEDKTIGPLQDAQEAVRIVRRNADKWHIDTTKIGIMGFSAGGHLASTLSTQYNKKVYSTDGTSARPDFSILVYPVISMMEGITHEGSKKNLLGDAASMALKHAFSNEEQVDRTTPPAFLVHAVDDTAVPDENSALYFTALEKNDIKGEIYFYKDGGHGFGLGTQGTHTQWPVDCEKWLVKEGFIPETEVFLFSYFKGNGEDGLHLAYSTDGYVWEAIQNDTPLLTPQVGKDKLMRDPCIIRGGDGRYHMVWTVSWTDKGIGYASSSDLIHWSEQKFIPVMAHEKGTRNTWAPEITYNPDTNSYMMYWASTIEGKFPETKSKKEDGYNHRMYYTTTENFDDFKETRLLYDPGFNVIDATIQKIGDRFIMFLKDETIEPPQKNIKIAMANALEGPYKQTHGAISGDYWAEGPTVIKVDDTWVVYFDKYIDHKYGAVASNDLKEWKDISDKIVFPEGTRHGTVIKVPRSVLYKLQKVDNDKGK